MQIGINEATTQLPQLVLNAQNGEEVFITDHGEIVAKIVSAGQNYNSKEDIINKLRAINKKSPLGTLEELMEWKEDGRR